MLYAVEYQICAAFFKKNGIFLLPEKRYNTKEYIIIFNEMNDRSGKVSVKWYIGK